MEDVIFTVTATHEILSDSPQLTDLTGTSEGNVLTFTNNLANDDASLTADVVNLKGSTLPETGGMGTRVLYALGGVLVVAALVLLVTKRRMGNN